MGKPCGFAPEKVMSPQNQLNEVRGKVMARNGWYIRTTAVIVFAFSSTSIQAQTGTSPASSVTTSLVVPEGATLRVVLTDKLRFKKNQLVHARTVDPVFDFD